MKAATILVVDDEPQIRRVMRTTLTAEGYAVIEARDGAEALEKLRSERPDLILLDMNMPVLDGLQTCREIRSSSEVPIIMLTVRSAEKDKVRALDAGADDYVVKPFSIQELLARVRALLRRVADQKHPAALVSKDLSIDFEKRTIVVRGTPVHLTPKEFAVLKDLVAADGRPITHRRLLQSVWGPDYRRRDGIAARGDQSAAKENRAQSGEASLHSHRTMGRLSLQHAGPHHPATFDERILISAKRDEQRRVPDSIPGRLLAVLPEIQTGGLRCGARPHRATQIQQYAVRATPAKSEIQPLREKYAGQDPNRTMSPNRWESQR